MDENNESKNDAVSYMATVQQMVRDGRLTNTSENESDKNYSE